jgi:Flp pilus assembly pilin Flp
MNAPSEHSPTAGLADERGQTLMEYGLILTLVSTALILSLMALGGDLIAFYDKVVGTLAALV